MKSLTIIACTFLLFTFSFNLSASTNNDITKYCLDLARAKLTEQADLYRCKIDLEQIEVKEVDIHTSAPFINIWYQVKSECDGFEKLINLVQYYDGQCF